MIAILLRRLISALIRNWHRVLLTLGIGIVGVLALGLLYHALSGNGEGQQQTMRLLAAYDKNWLIGLAFFSAIATGYTYWALQLIAEDSPDELRRRLELCSEIAFLGAVGWVIVGLLLWNLGLLVGVPSVS